VSSLVASLPFEFFWALWHVDLVVGIGRRVSMVCGFLVFKPWY